MSYQDCEGLAAHVVERGGWATPIDPWRVAASFKVRVDAGVPGQRPCLSERDGRPVIVVDPAERPERLGLAVLHELAHLLLEAHGLPNDDEHAWWLALAILLPRDEVLRARRRGATVEQIVAFHTHASHEAVGRRLVALSPSSVLWVWDVAPAMQKPYKVVSPGWRWRTREPTEPEREAMAAALSEGAPVEYVGGVRAWTAIDGEWVRVLCLSDAEVLLPHVSSAA